MFAVISPAKKLDFSPPRILSGEALPKESAPQLFSETQSLAALARTLSAQDLRKLMSLSQNLADLNFDRFQSFDSTSATPQGAKHAVLAFNGDTYTGLRASEFSRAEIDFANQRLRILSGLYGLLRPTDAMLPYRLEMGTRLKGKNFKNLYEFWGSKIATALNAELADEQSEVLVNLASQEYFSAVDRKVLRARVITCDFRELRDGQAKMISFFAKQGRGAMARYIIENRLDQPEQLKAFDRDGYRFDAALSQDDLYVFVRPDSRN